MCFQGVEGFEGLLWRQRVRVERVEELVDRVGLRWRTEREFLLRSIRLPMRGRLVFQAQQVAPRALNDLCRYARQRCDLQAVAATRRPVSYSVQEHEPLPVLSRIEMHEHVPPSATVDLPAIVAAAARALEGMAKERGIKLAIAPTTVAAVVVGDPDELTQVAQNLLQNAIKYGRPGGHIDVTIGDAGPRLALAIADDGMGIAPEHLPRLTERFYRVDRGRSREQGGTGLGLSIVKHLVQASGGDVWVESTPGVGSTFSFTLPSNFTRP